MESFPEEEIKKQNVEMNYLYVVKRVNTVKYKSTKSKIDIKICSKSYTNLFHGRNLYKKKFGLEDFILKQINEEKKCRSSKKMESMIKTDDQVKNKIEKKKSAEVPLFKIDDTDTNNNIIIIPPRSKNSGNIKINDENFGEGNISKVRTFNSKQNSDVVPHNFRKSKRQNLLTDEGKLTISIKSKNKYKKEDFEVLALSGKGAYGTVLQVKLKNDKNSDKNYAIKIMDIQSMIRVNKLYQAYLESDILNEIDNPFIVKTYGTFETKGKIYLIMDYLPKGDFSSFLKINHPLKEDTIKFYSAEIILFLEYFQSHKLVHRDLKPDNIMMNENYHLKMIDFATVKKLGYYFDKKEMKFKKDNHYDLSDTDDIKGEKLLVNPDDDEEDDEEEEEEEDEDEDMEEKEDKKENEEEKNQQTKKIKATSRRGMTFVGTAEYVSPEVIGDQPAGFGADIWAFGIMLYQMYFGKTPFKGSTTYLTFKNIEKPQISFPDDIEISDKAKDLILKILVKEPNKRLGAGEKGTPLDLDHLKKHAFFKGIKWENIINETPPNFEEFKFRRRKKSVKAPAKKKEEHKSDINRNIRIIKEGILNKKSFWFHYNKRYVILDTTPKIIYKEPDKDVIKGTIYLDKKCKINSTTPEYFTIVTQHSEYRFKAKNNDGLEWITAIKNCIKNYGKD